MGVENGVEVHPGQDGSQPPAYTNQQQPYTNQPPALPPGLPQANQQQWMPAVGASAGCPSGLEYLTQIDSVIIKQQVDLIEGIMPLLAGSRQTNIKLPTIKTNRSILLLRQDEPICNIVIIKNYKFVKLAGSGKASDIEELLPVVTRERGDNLKISRWRCNQRVNKNIACASDNKFIKTTKHPSVFELKNAEETADLGKISKKPGMAEIFTDANTFGANFPMNLDVKAKACVLGAVFLIDFMFFEGAGNKLMSYN
ncbi:Hypothetical predicted protein [Mytilus galloprovincialis]|uniref:Phospholipid scramblase n=1 Tax=Mytilus galloprovincialis TaxID=29158 RepID=A0A8B6DYN2_MYTGA|nr:Hypothetical predicted protein [Mytilus galloprovincialis]